MAIRKLLLKYKSIILYLVFGVATTLVNIIVYYLCAHIIGISTVFSTCIAWIFAVLFAFITNRIWVFESNANSVKAILREIVSFFSCRLATGILDIAIMYVFVDLIGINDVVVKVASNITVIILNYVASKFLIFRKQSKG